MTVSLILVFGCLSFTEVSVKVVNAERAHQDVCLFVQRGQHGGCGCRDSTKMFVCLFREVSVDIGCRESTKMFVCLFVQRGHRGGCGCREGHQDVCLFVQRGQRGYWMQREHQDVCLFVCSERSSWRLWMQRGPPGCLFVCSERSAWILDAERAPRCLFVCLFREVIVEVVDAERALQDQVAAAERREREERVATDLLQSLVDSTVDEQMSQIIQKEVE